jgi:hypothetical protein
MKTYAIALVLALSSISAHAQSRYHESAPAQSSGIAGSASHADNRTPRPKLGAWIRTVRNKIENKISKTFPNGLGVHWTTGVPATKVDK